MLADSQKSVCVLYFSGYAISALSAANALRLWFEFKAMIEMIEPLSHSIKYMFRLEERETNKLYLKSISSQNFISIARQEIKTEEE